MYKIVFHYWDSRQSETYSGGTYIFQGEKYAAFDYKNPKLYKSRKVAENSAQKLMLSCVNTSTNYDIVEVSEK